MADIKWVRIATDIFDSPKIKYIKAQPKGETMILLWFWLIARAGKCNAQGRVWISEGVTYSSDMIAAEIGAKTPTVVQGLALMEKLGMIERTAGGGIELINWEEHQNIVGMERIREQTRERVKRCRERNAESAQCNADCNVTSNGNVTPCNETEEEIDKDIEKEYCLRNTRKRAAGALQFADFWEAYPKKVGKQEAEKAFRKAFPAGDEHNVTIPAIERHKRSAQWTKDGGQFIPNPATWLNQKRWEDELTPATAAPSPANSTFDDSAMEAAVQRTLRLHASREQA